MAKSIWRCWWSQELFPKHDLRAVEHTDGAHGSRGHETQQAPRGVRTCEPWSTRTAHTAHEEEGHETQQAPRGVAASRVPSQHVPNSPQSVITHLVSLKGSVSPMRETPRATGSIASDCFSEAQVAQGGRLPASETVEPLQIGSWSGSFSWCVPRHCVEPCSTRTEDTFPHAERVWMSLPFFVCGRER